MFTQEELRKRFVDRITRARPTQDSVGAIAVVRNFTPATFVSSALTFASRITSEKLAAAWRGVFTRTIFLVGDPHNVVRRHRCDHLSPDGSIAWYGPGDLGGYEGLRRMLRPFRGPAGYPWRAEQRMRNPDPAAGEGARRVAVVHVVTDDLAVEEYLVHVNHLIAEAVMDGQLSKVAELVLCHGPDVPARPWDHVRVSVDSRRSDRFRAHAYLAIE